MRAPLMRRRLSVFDPLTLSPTLWLPSDAGAITIATGVSQWDDSSGNGYHFTQGTGGAQPAHNATGGPNSTSIVTSDGTDDCLVSTATLENVIDADGYMIDMIVKLVAAPDFYDSNDANCFNNEAIITDSAAYLEVAVAKTGPRLQCGHFGAAQGTAGQTIATGTWYRVRFMYDGTDISAKIGSASPVTATVGNVAVLTGTMSLFKQYLGATFVSAALAELIAFDYAPSAGDRTNIDSYYTSKFGPGLL
mgnify:CR=1 FL=1